MSSFRVKKRLVSYQSLVVYEEAVLGFMGRAHEAARKHFNDRIEELCAANPDKGVQVNPMD
jgi:hypothetical protein